MASGQNAFSSRSSANEVSMIVAENLGKDFRDKHRGVIRAVGNLSFYCTPGQVYGLLGANGAGKTTALRMLATILTPTSGTARVAGFDIRQEPEKARRNLGFLSTATALYGRLTAHEMVEYFGCLYGLDQPTACRRTLALFERLDINAFRNRRCEDLSTGIKQRVSIARTLVHDPPVMIFDEPTSGLDVISARTIVAFIRECREIGKTVIFSTHVMSEAQKLCDTIGIIHDGRLLAEGSLQELRSRYGDGDLEDIFVRVVTA
jgi:sodium transport system ATP-binding protein